MDRSAVTLMITVVIVTGANSAALFLAIGDQAEGHFTITLDLMGLMDSGMVTTEVFPYENPGLENEMQPVQNYNNDYDYQPGLWAVSSLFDTNTYFVVGDNIIWNKNRCNKEVDSGKGKGDSDECDSGDSDYEWFYTKKVPYFLEENENVNREIKDEKSVKNESSIIPHNSKEIKANTEVKEINLIDQYDEETVLLQIPQDDTRVEDVVKKFKNQNKVIDTIVALKDKGRIIDGQGYMRRLVDAEAVKNPDVPRSGVNRWICGDCGKKFHSQEPYRNRSDHAICDECADKQFS
jgi:hypothetical protein